MLKVVVVGRSDSIGGAAVVSRRLTEALRRLDVRAGMLVLEKKTSLPYVVEARYPLRKQAAFLAERAQIFLHNGFSRKNLWKVDTAAFGLPIWEHPMVIEADAVILNWVNQGMLSLDGIGKMCPPGKKVIWTMHDMWNLTGICHHAMECRRFEQQCGKCPFLNSRSDNDLSRSAWLKKQELYSDTDIHFVAVSSWLARKAGESSLMKNREITVIPNPFEPVPDITAAPPRHRILFAAASLDNWIKGLSVFRESIRIFKERYPDIAGYAEVVLMGAVKNPETIGNFALPTEYTGVISSDEQLAKVFAGCDVIVNSSHFENLPGTLIEGQAYGAVPVAFDRGGQRDIITDGETGILVEWNDVETERASRLADGIAAALRLIHTDPDAVRTRMRHSVSRFSYSAIAARYLDILNR